MIDEEIASFLKESNDIEGYVFPIEDYVERSTNDYIDGQFAAYDFLKGHLERMSVNSNRYIDYGILSILHSLLMFDLPDSENIKIGEYRDCDVQVGGRLCPEPFLAAELMNNWFLDFKSMEHDPLKMHYRFELIHPFQDGNGRIGRLLYLYDLLRRGSTVKNILDNYEGNNFIEKRANYYRAIDNFNNKK